MERSLIAATPHSTYPKYTVVKEFENTQRLDKLENIFEDRVAKALGKLGVSSTGEINVLAARVEELDRKVQKMGVRVPAGKTAARTAAKLAAKTAAGQPPNGPASASLPEDW